MKKCLITFNFIFLISLFNLNAQFNGNVYIGTNDGAEAVYCFDSIFVKIIFKMDWPDEDFDIIYPYMIKGDTLIIEHNYFRIKKNIMKLREIKSAKKSYRDKLFLYNEKNPYHKWLINEVKQKNFMNIDNEN